MSTNIFKFPSVLLSAKRKNHVKIKLIKTSDIKDWIKKQGAATKAHAKETGFDKGEATLLSARSQSGKISEINAKVPDNLGLYDTAKIAGRLSMMFDKAYLKETSFELTGLKGEDLEKAHIGFIMAAHKDQDYKAEKSPIASLVPPPSLDKKRVKALCEAMMLTRNLVNTPANDMGPEEIEAAAKTLATKHKAKIKVTKGKALEKEFPLVHIVGMASTRPPRLIDLTWGNAKHPKVTLVGKGVAFDTGGLDLKPSQYMKLMKKDMGGAAHVLGLAKLIMDLKLPVRLRMIIPAVENAVAGNAFRPGDVFTSRKGTTVENTNTDAEGRLILADALTLASEENPDLIIDYATLTGSARAALGPDIPAMFSSEEKTGAALQSLSFAAEDPVWRMPLWAGYKDTIKASTGELHNSAGVPGDLIYSALFLESFLVGKQDWVHLDTHAWHLSGKPGRPKGGADMGLRAVFAYLEGRYAS